MINSLLSFGAKSVSPKILEQTLTVRGTVVDDIEQNCINKTFNSSTWQTLIIAPRGSGKTHLIKVLYHRLKNNKKIKHKSVIAYMSEDEVGIANFTDLMVSILRAIIRYKEPGSEMLESQIIEASLIKESNKREIFVKDILINFTRKRVIILLIENFDKILKSLGSDGQGSLRDFIHQYNNLSIIATSQNLIATLQDSKNPFYNFFNVTTLNKLDLKETMLFLETVAKTEGNQKLIDEMNKPSFEGKLRTIYELTEGNHRLLVTFYSFLKADFKSELSHVFVKVMNDLKPYYEQFINALPAQQQKIVKFLSMNRGAISGKEIARACFIEPNVFSKQVSLLFEKRLLDKSKSGKDVFYELKEPLMRICFEISESTDGIAKLFVDFLSCYYDSREIRNQYVLFKYGARFQNAELKKKYQDEAMMYRLALDRIEQVRVSFKHELFDKSDNLNELNKLIQSIDFGSIKQINLRDDYFTKGNNYFQKEQFKEALECFQKVVKTNKNNDLAYFNIGLTYGHLRNHKKAMENFKKATEINPKGEEAYINLGVSLANLKQNKEAIKYYKKTIELNPDNDLAYFNMGVAHADLKQYEEAIKNYNKVIRISPYNIEAYYNLGIALFNMNQYEKAIKKFQKIIEINPDNQRAFFSMGVAFSNLKQDINAIKSYQKAVEINPKNKTAYFNMGVAFTNLKKYKESIKCYQNIIEIDQNYDDAYWGLGVAHAELKQYKKAISNYKKAIEINPTNDVAYLNLGSMFAIVKQFKDSIESYQKAVEINPRNNLAYYSMGFTYMNLKQYEKAIKCYEKAIEINPEVDSVYYSLGNAFVKLKQYKEAIINYQQVVDKNPKKFSAYWALGITYADMEQYNEAIESYENALKIHPNNDLVYFSMGAAYANLEQYNKAIESYKKAVEINPKNHNFYLGMGVSFYGIKQYNDAIKSFIKAVQIDSNDELIFNGLGLAYLSDKKFDKALETFQKGLEINPDNKHIKFSLLGAYVRINDRKKCKELMVNLINDVDNKLLIISLKDDVFYNLFKFGSDAFIKSYFSFLLKLIIKEKKNMPFWKALADSLFEILINIENYSKESLSYIEQTLHELLDKHPERIIPLQMFSVGVAYLKNDDKNSIFKLSKEERKFFKEAVLDKREKLGKDIPKFN